MKTILIISGILVVVYLCYRTYRAMTLDKGLEKQLANGAIILDVRTENEYNTGHIKDLSTFRWEPYGPGSPNLTQRKHISPVVLTA